MGGAEFEAAHRVVSNLYDNLSKLGGAHAPGAPGSYAYGEEVQASRSMVKKYRQVDPW